MPYPLSAQSRAVTTEARARRISLDQHHLPSLPLTFTLHTMPLPLVPTTSSENLARREPISRVTSFKRDWEGSDELKHTARKLGSTNSGDMAESRAFKRARSDAEIEWSPTPPKQP